MKVEGFDKQQLDEARYLLRKAIEQRDAALAKLADAERRSTDLLDLGLKYKAERDAALAKLAAAEGALAAERRPLDTAKNHELCEASRDDYKRQRDAALARVKELEDDAVSAEQDSYNLAARVREWQQWYGTEVPSDEYCNSLAQSKAHVAKLREALVELLSSGDKNLREIGGRIPTRASIEHARAVLEETK